MTEGGQHFGDVENDDHKRALEFVAPLAVILAVTYLTLDLTVRLASLPSTGDRMPAETFQFAPSILRF